MRQNLFFGLAFLWLSFAPTPARADVTRQYELEGFGHFLEGNPESTALTEDGAITLAPKVHAYHEDASATYSAAAPFAGGIALARVRDAQVLLIDAKGGSKALFKAEEPVVSSMLATENGLLVATGAPAKIYRVDAAGKATVWFTPEANYVWRMAPGDNGSIYLATGEPGTVIKVESGRGQVLHTFEQAHIRSVAYHHTLGLFVGGGERGVLFRAPNEKNFRALIDTTNTEITEILLDDQYAYISGVSGAAALLLPEDKKAKASEVRSQILRVRMDGTADVLAGSNDEAVFAMAFDAQKHVVVATGATGREDPRGRLYSIDTARRTISLIHQSLSKRITQLIEGPGHTLLAVGATGGRITELQPQFAKEGVFYTNPADMGVTSVVGTVALLGQYPDKTRVMAQVRTGQTAEPDAGWSPWSPPIDAKKPQKAQVAPGRYLQTRLTLSGNGSVTPMVHRLRVAYLRQNLPPFVRDVSVLRRGVALLSVPHEEIKAKMVLIGDKSEDGREERTAPQPPRARQVPDPGALAIKWLADDPNGDELRYELYVRQLKEDAWTLLVKDLTEPFHTMRSSQFSDGHYVFRVRASDHMSNALGLERTDQRDSRAVLIDTTPPVIRNVRAKVQGTQVTITYHVSDAVGPLVELTYALDHATERMVLPDDGVLDGPQEDVTLNLANLAPGSHQVTLRAMDEAQNEVTADVRFDIKPLKK